ncbi:glycosyltransferase [Anabaena sp. UHCC 0451]|uniref:glycosyltransferase n=1 Tax=Anabaena sp. UHCC 0451 TaxID=2055235 RepID=UPI002B1EAFF0|nr:glycosyltransferase [Anabaena sp. UHCC 0451]MEA5576908.1 glycosyltransferase [Anabaena sp. UHCC 0451]
MQLFEHYILTLFNVDRGFDKTNKRNSIEYLEKRFELFESVTVPSINSQTNQNFFWLIFFDINTPDVFKKRAEETLKMSNCLPVYVQGEQEILPFLKGKLLPKTQCLVTTNLDNDDALHKNFVGIIQSNFRDEKVYFLNITLGYMLRHDGLLMREFLSSPFHTIVETVSDELLTCLSVPHHYLYSLSMLGVPVYQIASEPAWLQLVHDTNVVNRLDVNAVLIWDVTKIKNFAITNLPSNFQDIAKASMLNFVYKLIIDKKRSYKQKSKQIIYTLFSFLVPAILKVKFFWQYRNKRKVEFSKSEILKIINDMN